MNSPLAKAWRRLVLGIGPTAINERVNGHKGDRNEKASSRELRARMKFAPDDIHERLLHLSKRDKKRRVFGSSLHNYTLNPPLDADVVEVVEAENDIEFPADYKLFITQIGNGGAGPFYGVHPFGHDDNGLWKDGGFVSDLGQPFPHERAWNQDDAFWAKAPRLPDGVSLEEEDRAYEEWDKVLDEEYWRPSLVFGAIPIVAMGCGLYQWLVVHGPQRGFVWVDYRADHAGLFPCRNASGQQLSFSDWYLEWLDNPESRMPKGDSR